MSLINAEAQAAIDSLKTINYLDPKIDRQKIEELIGLHLNALNLPARETVWVDNPNEFMTAARAAARDAARTAAWDAARTAAWDAARAAAWDAARAAAIKNSVPGHKSEAVFETIRAALVCGLYAYLVQPERVICLAIPQMFIGSDGRLHRDGGPAVLWPGEKYWFLNGVKVSKEISETPAEKIDCNLVLTEKNAEVRRELVRKIGMERIVLKLGAKSMDKWKGYELLDFHGRPYLKMKNPSIGVWHVEGVATGIKTVRDALIFRRPDKMRAIPIDDVGGEEWYAQGDVNIWPRDAKSLKLMPEILT